MPTQAQVEAQSEWGLGRRKFLRMTAAMALTVLLPGCQHPPATQPPTRPEVAETERYRKPSPWRIGRSGRGDINSWMIMCSAHIEYGIKERYREHF